MIVSRFNQPMYCIKCEKMVIVLNAIPFLNISFQETEFKPFHEKIVDGQIVDCEGEFTSSPPPELTEEEWEKILSEPDPKE